MGQRNNQKAATKSGTSDNGINFRVPGKRAHSKNDKYEINDPNTPMNLGMSGPMTTQIGGVMGGAIGASHLSPMDQNQFAGSS